MGRTESLLDSAKKVSMSAVREERALFSRLRGGHMHFMGTESWTRKMLSSVVLRCYLGAVWKTWCGWQPLEPSAMVPISTLMGYRCTMLCMWVQFEGLLWCCYCMEAILISFTPVLISKMQEKRSSNTTFFSGFIDIYKVDSLLKLIISVSTWKETVSEKKSESERGDQLGTYWHEFLG